jgi:outer membrane lipoprotein LolB
LVLALTALGGCRSLPPRPAISWDQRCDQLRAKPSYSFTGRVAASAGGAGLSASLDWLQQGASSRLSLRGPLGLGAIEVELDGAAAIAISDAAGNRLEGDAARESLKSVLGLDPPLAHLRYWLLACSAPGTMADVVLNAEAQLQSLSQDGWQVEFLTYQQVAGIWLPARLRARHADQQLQLLISRWRLP